jgi:hypothetical protein
MTVKRTPAKRRRAAAEGAVDPRFAPVAAAFAGDRRVSRARRFSTDSVLSVGGKIFAMLARDKFVAKLPKERVDALVRAGTGERFDPGSGRVMKEWIAVGPGRADWIALAKEAYRFVRQRAPR